MKICTTILLLILFSVSLFTQQPKLLIRCDDIGMSHSVNMAAEELIKTGIPFSASVMFACPWYQEGVEILRNQPQISVGIHLTLNAEWKNYRWGPVAGQNSVKSLVDSCGYFFPSRASLYNNNPKLEDIEAELRAQIERAKLTGLKIDYLDYHMGTAVDKPEYRKIVEKLARDYNLGISRYFGEIDSESMYDDPIETKADSLLLYLTKLNGEKINLLVCHISKDSPEMQAMIDLNPFGPEQMSKHRDAELKALVSNKIQTVLKSGKLKLLTYSDLIKDPGLSKMKSPEETGY